MTSEHALAARKKIREDAEIIGVNEAFISQLVDEFYARIRQHERLGPIFMETVADWPEHLVRLKQFWESVALHAGSFSGRPMQVHMKIKAIEAAHFGEWLFLFEQTLRDIAPTEQAIAYFMVRAHRIGENLKLGLSYRPS